MYSETTTLHASEPSHLALGKLMDGCFELEEHLVVRDFANGILSQELVLQAIVNQVFGRYSFCQQAPHLVHHTFIQTLLKATGDFLTTQFTVDVHTDNQALE